MIMLGRGEIWKMGDYEQDLLLTISLLGIIWWSKLVYWKEFLFSGSAKHDRRRIGSGV